jgi:hypothetical protein
MIHQTTVFPTSYLIHNRPLQSTRAKRCAGVRGALCCRFRFGWVWLGRSSHGHRGRCRRGLTPPPRDQHPNNTRSQVVFWKSELDHTIAEKNAWKDRCAARRPCIDSAPHPPNDAPQLPYSHTT